MDITVFNTIFFFRFTCCGFSNTNKCEPRRVPMLPDVFQDDMSHQKAMYSQTPLTVPPYSAVRNPKQKPNFHNVMV